jgi:hypothetical protein
MDQSATVIFQSAKLGDVPGTLAGLEWARSLLEGTQPIARVCRLSGGTPVRWPSGSPSPPGRHRSAFERQSRYHSPFTRPRTVAAACENGLTDFLGMTAPRRQMRALTDLLYRHYQFRNRHSALLRQAAPEVACRHPLPPGFRQDREIGCALESEN